MKGLALALTATVYLANAADARGEERSSLAVGAVVRGADATPIEATVRNLSRTGCLVVMPASVAVGEIVSIGISGIGRVDVRVVRHEGDLHGLEFLRPISRALVDAAHHADTVVRLPERSFMPEDPFESSMPDPDRWSRGARVGFLIAAGIGCWVLPYGLLRIL